MSSATAYILYLVFALGGAGTYLLMPRGERTQPRAGAVVGLLGVVGLLATLGARVVAPSETSAYFFLFATIAVVAAARVITHPKPVYSALYFVVVVIAVASLLVLMQAEFLAVALIIVYAGAIMVTYLFVIMLAQQPGSPVYDRRSREPFLAVLAGFVLMAAVAGRAEELPTPVTRTVMMAAQAADPTSPTAKPAGNTAEIGSTVMTRYVVALEIAGVLLLVSMVGAVALTRKKVPIEGFAPPRRPLGAVGREVEPY